MGMGEEPGAGMNPYAPPAANIDAVPSQVTPAGAAATGLYSPRQMGWAALLGGFVLGVLFMHANYRALGNQVAARRTLWLGVAATVILYAILLSSHEAQTRVALVVASVIFAGLADFLQGRTFHRHVAAGGPRKSHWLVAGWILVCTLALVGLLVVEQLVTGGEMPEELTGPLGRRY